MKAFSEYLWLQFKMDLRDKGTLLNFYLVPLVFFGVMGSVFSTISPLMRTTLAASMSIFAITMGAVMGIPAPIVKLREMGTMRAFRVNGIPGLAVLSVQAISAFLHMFVAAVIIYLVAPLAFNAKLPSSPGYYFVVLAVFLLASIAIGLLVGVVSRSQSFATMLSMVIFLPSLLLSGIMFPINMLPKPMMWVGRSFPATQAMQSFTGLAYHMKTDFSADLALGSLAGFGVIVFVLTAWRFNRIGKLEI